MGQDSSSIKTGKILIVDDSRPFRQAIRRLVSPHCEQVFEAGDGGQAVESYFLNKPDWVTMDLGMEPTDGMTALKQITDRDPGARILIVTVHDEASLAEAAQQAGAVAYLLKDNFGDIVDFITRPNPPSRELPNQQ